MDEVYAFQNTQAEVMQSSSGGAFIALCKAFEAMYAGNTVFCGAAFDDKMNVVHRCVNSAAECEIFKGSKYVKSRCEIQNLALDLAVQNGKHILFSGTPCQIYSLNQYIKKRSLSRQMFLTVDVICHGAPRKEFWDAYRGWLEERNGSKITKYSFRYKSEGWKAYPAFARFENGKELVNTAETSVYSKMHMARYSITKGCFSCPFAKEERVSDITLGDYWGVEKVFPKLAYKNGVSLVIAHSQPGVALVEVLGQSEDVFLQKTADKTYLQHQHNLRKPTECPEQYEKFWIDFAQMPFEAVLRKYIGYGCKYRVMHQIKKLVRKTPLIEWYRNRRKGSR